MLDAVDSHNQYVTPQRVTSVWRVFSGRCSFGDQISTQIYFITSYHSTLTLNTPDVDVNVTI